MAVALCVQPVDQTTMMVDFPELRCVYILCVVLRTLQVPNALTQLLVQLVASVAIVWVAAPVGT